MHPYVTLTVKQGKLAGKTYVLDDNRTWLIGRSAECDVHVPGDLEFLDISRRHCLVAVNGTEVHIRDVGSRNGTFVNGLRINSPAACTDSPENALQLKNGDEVALGSARGLMFNVQVSACQN